MNVMKTLCVDRSQTTVVVLGHLGCGEAKIAVERERRALSLYATLDGMKEQLEIVERLAPPESMEACVR